MGAPYIYIYIYIYDISRLRVKDLLTIPVIWRNVDIFNSNVFFILV